MTLNDANFTSNIIEYWYCNAERVGAGTQLESEDTHSSLADEQWKKLDLTYFFVFDAALLRLVVKL